MHINKICEVKHIIIKMACLVCLLLLSMSQDNKTYKISNYIVLTGILTGIIFQFHEAGWKGLLTSGGGIVLPILLLFPLFLFKMFGAGDIKLFSVVGSYYGIYFVIHSIVIAFILAAIMSIYRLLRYNQFFDRLHYLINYVQSMYQLNHLNYTSSKRIQIIPYYDVKKEGYKGVIHFSAAIAGAVVIQIVLFLYPM